MSGTILFANDAQSWLTTGVGAADISITLPPGDGARFPAVGAGQYFAGVLEDLRTGAKEYVRATSRSADTVTVIRGREGSTALDFPAGSTFSLRLTAETLALFAAGGGGSFVDAPIDGNLYARQSGEWVELEAAYDLYFDMGLNPITANAERGLVLARDIRIPADMVGSQVSLVAGDASAPVFTLLKNTTGIATLTLSAVGGTWAAVTPGVDITAAIGDTIKFRAPAVVAAAFVGLRASVAAYRS